MIVVDKFVGIATHGSVNGRGPLRSSGRDEAKTRFG